MMGLGASLNLFIIDFGLAKRYKDPKTGTHISLVKHNVIIIIVIFIISSLFFVLMK